MVMLMEVFSAARHVMGLSTWSSVARHCVEVSGLVKYVVEVSHSGTATPCTHVMEFSCITAALVPVWTTCYLDPLCDLTCLKLGKYYILASDTS